MRERFLLDEEECDDEGAFPILNAFEVKMLRKAAISFSEKISSCARRRKKVTSRKKKSTNRKQKSRAYEQKKKTSYISKRDDNNNNNNTKDDDGDDDDEKRVPHLGTHPAMREKEKKDHENRIDDGEQQQ